MSIARVLLVALSAVIAGALPARAGTPIVFVSRALDTSQLFETLTLEPDGNIVHPVPRTSAVERAPHGRLVLLDASGSARILVDSRAADAPSWTPVDVADPDISFDGSRIVFSGYAGAEAGWRIYEVGIDATGLRKLTDGTPAADLSRYGAAAERLRGHDDLDPCYLPDGRICFVSTRYPEIAPDNRLRSTNLFVMSGEGTSMHRITTERFGADTPAVDPASGRIVYSRWWRTAQAGEGTTDPAPIPPGSPGYGDPGQGGTFPVSPSANVVQGVDEGDFPGVNSWFLSRINPDGTDLAMLSGFRLDRGLTQAYRPSFLPGGEILALFIPKTPFLGFPRGNGLRAYHAGPGLPESLGGPQSFVGEVVMPAAGMGIIAEPPVRESDGFLFASAAGLPDGRIIVSAAPRGDRPQYDLYALERSTGHLTLIHGSPDSLADLDAVPALARPLPPEIPDRAPGVMANFAPRTVEEARREGGTFTFVAENIHFNAPVDTPIVNAPPVGRELAIEFFMVPQGTRAEAADPPVLIRRQEIGPDGRVEVDLPAGVPLFEVLRLPDGSMARGRDGQIFHVGGMNFSRAGERARCVGCHAGHSFLEAPADASWTNLAGSALLTADPPLRLPFADDQVMAGEVGVVPAFAPFGPESLVDRRTDPFSEWLGAFDNSVPSSVTLEWSVPISAREVVVHGPRPGQGPATNGGLFGPRDQQILGFTVITTLRGSLAQEIPVRQTIQTAAPPVRVAVPLDPSRPFDALRLTIRPEDVRGQFELGRGPALSEVEVVARAVEPAPEPTYRFQRGDSNCDGRLDLTDAVAVLDRLFLGGKRLCCEAAADADGNRDVNLTDPVVVLNFLFLGGKPPAFPSGVCDRAPAAGLTCDIEVCSP